jgi:hypothetical protein
MKYRNQAFGRASSHIVRIDLRYETREDVLTTVPAQYVTFEFGQAHRSKAEPPQIPSGMKEIKMCPQARNSNLAAHAKAGF